MNLPSYAGNGGKGPMIEELLFVLDLEDVQAHYILEDDSKLFRGNHSLSDSVVICEPTHLLFCLNHTS